MPPFALYRVAADAVPFVCVRLPGDGASLLAVEEALRRVPINLVNDVIARWSVGRVIMAGGGGRRRGRGAVGEPAAAEAAEAAAAAAAAEGEEDGEEADGGSGESAGDVDGDVEPAAGDEEYTFWPGGRLKAHGDDVAAEEAAARAWRPSERDEEQLGLWVAGLKDVDPD